MDNLENIVKEWYHENAPLGKSLGYPQCCINEFCAQPPELLKRTRGTKADVQRYEAAHKNGEYTGFIPCHNHAKEILNGNITLESLIQNRDEKWGAFPYDYLESNEKPE